MKKGIIALISALFMLSSCTWVELTPMGEAVKLIDQNEKILETCTKLGSVSTMVKHKIGSFTRSEAKVDTELITLAQNRAAEMGGDTIAATGPAKDGRRPFAVYNCGN